MDAEAERKELEREFEDFARLLSGRPPAPALSAKYVEAHACGAVRPSRGIGGFDRALCGLARLGPLGARAADAHAAVLDRRGLLRHKLVLALALLESSAESAKRVDSPSVRSTGGFVLGAVGRAAGWLLLFLAGLVPLSIARMLCAFAAPRQKIAEPGRAP